MRRVVAPLVWAYDFLAEDVTLLGGTALVIALSVLVAHTANVLSGVVLFVGIVVVIGISLWRARTAA